jgi:DNA-binding MarR family transcriptional regulator
MARKSPLDSTPSRVPGPGEGKRGNAGYLSYLLRQAQAAVRLTLERDLAALDVTPPQFVVLTMIGAYPGLSGADLARLTFLTPQTVGVITRNLERAGAIVKARHPIHGRVLQWALTPKGRLLLAASRQRAHAVEARLVAQLPRGSDAAIRLWLTRIATELIAGGDATPRSGRVLALARSAKGRDHAVKRA